MTFIKRILFWGILGGILYVLLSFHFIYFGGRTVKLLKKSKLTLNYTFFSTSLKTNRHIISVDELRKDGIADLMVEMGRMSEKERERLLEYYEEEEEEE